MLPFLADLDICVSRPVHDEEALSPGDIVVYRGREEGDLLVHRVVSVLGSGDGTQYHVKGDNSPLTGSEELLPADIIEKVVSVDRSGFRTDLTSPKERLKARIMAFLSRRDLMPLRCRKRFIEPVMLWWVSNRAFRAVRICTSGYYSRLHFSLHRTAREDTLRVYACLGKKDIARIDLRRVSPGVLAYIYVRYRDRNHVFARILLGGLRSIIDREFGTELEVFLDREDLAFALPGLSAASVPRHFRFGEGPVYDR
jgi:hypothetical protein